MTKNGARRGRSDASARCQASCSDAPACSLCVPCGASLDCADAALLTCMPWFLFFVLLFFLVQVAAMAGFTGLVIDEVSLERSPLSGPAPATNSTATSTALPVSLPLLRQRTLNPGVAAATERARLKLVLLPYKGAVAAGFPTVVRDRQTGTKSVPPSCSHNFFLPC